MRPSVEQQIRSRGVEQNDILIFLNRELLPWARQTRQVTNYISRTKGTIVTAGTSAFTTVWQTNDIAVGQVIRLDASVMGTQSNDRAALTITGTFFNNGTTQQEGATFAGYTQNAPGYGVQFLIVSNHVELQVQDIGAQTTWLAVVDAMVIS